MGKRMTGTVRSVARLADGVYDLRVEAGLTNPAPGRFVHLAVPGFPLRRPISLCGCENGVARLVFAVKGGGTAAMAAWRPGDTVDLLGALGNGFPEPDGGAGKTVLVGGGIGLPPLLYYAKTHPDTHCIAGFRSAGHVILAGEFPSLELCTDDGSAGFSSYPHQRLEELLKNREPVARVLACGPEPLLKATAKVCREFGTPCFVSAEERMGCGVGACLVCVCAAGGTYKRVCKDGPVFDAAEWGETV
ncbi:MAG: dihydroorotate dehydrogenase electron transfer subunit [Oscillospiraceae bacterium]|jgi:dihydroorotate dehydrogenase electron transfer subunit|nr:dihydroorotate dehydrogenase electron transfer subunit [Oscillospiraceae bacterium]